jgi:exodeoxyribonuclease-3
MFIAFYLPPCYHSLMKIISWNVNGLRAVHRKGSFDWLLNESPDIFCLQETKSTPDQLPPEVKSPQGYHSYFDIPKEKKGYSGVAIYSKVEPEQVEYMMGNEALDKEGRLIAAYYKDFVLLNVYFPNGKSGPDRLKYKLEFYDAFLGYIEKLRKKGHKVVFCGDINTAHFPIDLARPRENMNVSGFLPIERAWLDKVVSHDYVDVFRHFNPDKKDAYTYWDMKTFSRDRNVGWRIDYFFASKNLLPKIKKMEILSNVLGSDHCPLLLEIAL